MAFSLRGSSGLTVAEAADVLKTNKAGAKVRLN